MPVIYWQTPQKWGKPLICYSTFVNESFRLSQMSSPVRCFIQVCLSNIGVPTKSLFLQENNTEKTFKFFFFFSRSRTVEGFQKRGASFRPWTLKWVPFCDKCLYPSLQIGGAVQSFKVKLCKHFCFSKLEQGSMLCTVLWRALMNSTYAREGEWSSQRPAVETLDLQSGSSTG